MATTDPASVLRFLGRLLAVIALSAVVGFGLGYGLSEAKGGAGTPPPPPFHVQGADGGTGASGATGAVGGDTTGSLDVSVTSSTIEAATTASGRRRDRARTTIGLRIKARGGSATLGEVELAVGSDTIAADPNAVSAAGGLFDPVAAGASVTGELRFETSGAVTRQLESQLSARLKLRDRSIPVTLKRR